MHCKCNFLVKTRSRAAFTTDCCGLCYCRRRRPPMRAVTCDQEHITPEKSRNESPSS